MSERKYTIDEQMIIDNLKSETPHICYYCGKKLAEKDIVTIDHKIPVCRGGLTIKSNLVIACWNCNHEKDNMTEEEYITYKQKLQEMQDTFEVNNAIKKLLEYQNGIIERIECVRKEYDKVEKQIEFLQYDIMFNNFNASEGYLYARRLKELLIKKNELSVIKNEYSVLHSALGNHNKQLLDVGKKISTEVHNINKPLIKRQLIKDWDNQVVGE
jgi:hypothetical protein